MMTNILYIVQYVGFATTDDQSTFIKNWLPFASRFKTLGIRSIDLYAVAQPNSLNFISRNIWQQEIYFRNFPGGMAGTGGGMGISVKQLGAYGIQPDQLDQPDQMKLVFLNTIIDSTDPLITHRSGVTINMPYKQVFELAPQQNLNTTEPILEFICKYIASV